MKELLRTITTNAHILVVSSALVALGMGLVRAAPNNSGNANKPKASVITLSVGPQATTSSAPDTSHSTASPTPPTSNNTTADPDDSSQNITPGSPSVDDTTTDGPSTSSLAPNSTACTTWLCNDYTVQNPCATTCPVQPTPPTTCSICGDPIGGYTPYSQHIMCPMYCRAMN